jgi:hypothetical protein
MGFELLRVRPRFRLRPILLYKQAIIYPFNWEYCGHPKKFS